MKYIPHGTLVVLFSILYVGAPACGVVTVTEDGSSVTLANGIISAVFGRNSGEMTSYCMNGGANLLADGGKVYYDLSGGFGHASIASGRTLTYQVIANTSSHVEISFYQSHNGRAPYDIDLRYVLRDGDHGVYWYSTYHKGSDFTTEKLAQWRLVVRCDAGIFDHYRFTDERYGPLADPSMVYNYGNDMADGVYDGVSPNGAERLTPGEASLLQDGSIDYKYLTHNRSDESDVYGAYGAHGQGYCGLWMITPSYESIGCGHSKQNLAVHSTTSTTCLLRMLHGGHYGGGRGIDFGPAEEWTKFFGPFMLYVNTAESADELWQDAKAKAAVEKDAFPHSWVDHPAFGSDIRSTVTGNLNITNGSRVTGAWIGLVEEDGDDRYWGQSVKGYQYWAQVHGDGSFTIEDVRGAGSAYTLYAHVDGVMDEYTRQGVEVLSRDLDLGTINWAPVKHGETIWQIGYADRSAREFRHGNELSQWGLWLKYSVDFPDDVNFIIGQSNEATDWNFAQCPVGWTEPYRECVPNQFTMPDWKITFDYDGDSDGATGYLTLATVSCSLIEGKFFRVLLNGTELAAYEGALEGSELGLGGAMARTSHYGGVDYRQNVVEFDASLLQPTDNVITLRSDGDRLDAIMYDCIRLEVRSTSDLNADGEVNVVDFAMMAGDWMECTYPSGTDCTNLR